MTKKENSKQFDLEDSTLEFAKRVREFVAGLKNTPGNTEDIKQLTRSSGSIGANYIEANEALSKKDFLMRIKICRKEAKESRYWLRLIDTDDKEELEKQRKALENEARELTHIFGSIVTKSKYGFEH
jgi:four helix bundle protein